jgi:sucrose-phosphate synthase
MPSIKESFGIAGLEAMAAGVPAVVSRHAGLYKLINDPEILLGIDPEDETDMTNKLESLVASKQEMARRAAEGTQVASRYTWKKVADKYDDLYHKASCNIKW